MEQEPINERPMEERTPEFDSPAYWRLTPHKHEFVLSGQGEPRMCNLCLEDEQVLKGWNSDYLK